MILAYTNAIILILISAIHFYWAAGGKWAMDSVFPEIKSSNPIRPSILATVFVAFVFLGFAIIYLSKTPLFSIQLPLFFKRYGVLILAGIFIIRAIGEFKYVGFFKTMKDSKFAKLDTKFYSPLCLYLGVSSLIISFLYN